MPQSLGSTLQPDRRRAEVIDASDRFRRPTQTPIGGIVAAIGIFTAAIAAAIAINGKEVPPESALGKQLQPLAAEFTETVSALSSATTDFKDSRSGEVIQDLEGKLDEIITRRETLIAQAECKSKAKWTYGWMTGETKLVPTMKTNVNRGCNLE